MKFLFIIPTLFNVCLFAQKKIYNNKIINPKIVNINTHIDSQIVYNPAPKSAKLYLLDTKAEQQLIINHSTNRVDKGRIFYTIIIGNPDSAIVYDPKFRIVFTPGYDTAYFDNSNFKFDDINNKGARDQHLTINKDHKEILYNASYWGAGYKKVLHVICSDDNANFFFDGLGTLF